ncbi:MAG: hypothetical protein ACKPB4_12620, partial [Sphaerospermopsis kisseleviana]
MAVIGVCSMSLTLTKHIWQDEVQILEAGRLALPGADRSYSMIWSFEANRPFMLPYYLGPALQDTFCRLFGQHTPLGPRLSSLIGAVLASGALLGWLLSRGSVPWIALACSLLFFLDPLFVESYRGARVDSWSMAFMLLTLWVVSAGRKESLRRGGFAAWQVIGGISMAFAAIFWVSAILLVPLVVYEVLRQEPSGKMIPWPKRLLGLIWLGIFGATALALVLTPILGSLTYMLSDTSGMAGGKMGLDIDLTALLAPCVRSPWLPLGAIAAILISQSWGLAAATMVAVGGVLMTGAYVHRTIYLLPYFLVAIATGASFVWTKASPSGFAKLLAFSVLLSMLVWSAALSVGARTFVALSERQARDSGRLLAMLEDSVGSGPYHAYIDAFELYYAARSLGWKSYRTVGKVSDLSCLKLRDLLADMDVVVLRSGISEVPP